MTAKEESTSVEALNADIEAAREVALRADLATRAEEIRAELGLEETTDPLRRAQQITAIFHAAAWSGRTSLNEVEKLLVSMLADFYKEDPYPPQYPEGFLESAPPALRALAEEKRRERAEEFMYGFDVPTELVPAIREEMRKTETEMMQLIWLAATSKSAE